MYHNGAMWEANERVGSNWLVAAEEDDGLVRRNILFVACKARIWEQEDQCVSNMLDPFGRGDGDEYSSDNEEEDVALDARYRLG